MKKNNKGFIATSVLFGIVALIFVMFAIILGESHASYKNSKLYGNMLKEEITDFLGVTLFPMGGFLEKTKLEIDYNGTYGGTDGLPTPVRTGYKFKGWYTTKTGGQAVTSSTNFIDVLAYKLYAQWEANKYNLTIDPNEGTHDGYTSPRTLNLDFDSLTDISNPTKVGHVFDGWSLSDTQSGSAIINNKFRMGNSNVVITANWLPTSSFLEVNPNGGKFNGKTDISYYEIKYNETQEIENPIRDGYIFTGWTVEYFDNNNWIEDKTNQYLNGTLYKANEKDVRIIANWKSDIFKYYVQHHQESLDGGFTLIEADTEEGEAAFGTIVTTYPKNYTGFTSSSDSQTLEITSDSNQNFSVFTYGRNIYNLRIDPNGGIYNGDLNIEIKYKDSREISNPEKTGYTFKNWTADSGSFADKIYTIDASDATIVANWTTNNYILTLDLNYDNLIDSISEVSYDSTYGTLPNPSRTGYKFKGWSLTKDGKNIVTSSTVVNTASDHKLYAVWQAETYTLNLNARNGSVSPSTISVMYDGTYENLPTPTRANHKFLGWYTDEIAGVLVNKTDTVTIVSDQTLYARWLPTDAQFIQYSNSSYTTCDNVACTLNELYNMFK